MKREEIGWEKIVIAILALLLFAFTIPNAEGRSGIVYDTRNNYYLGWWYSTDNSDRVFNANKQMTLDMWRQPGMPVPLQYIGITDDVDFARKYIYGFCNGFYIGSPIIERFPYMRPETTLQTLPFRPPTTLPNKPVFKPFILTSENVPKIRKMKFNIESDYELARPPNAICFATDVVMQKKYVAKK